MSTYEIIFEVLEATGLNWTVEKRPLYYESGTIPPFIEVPGNYSTVRSDNGRPLGLVKERYSILQNHEMVELVLEASGNLFVPDKKIKHPWDNADTLGTYGNIAGGSLKGGEAVFCQIELPEGYIGKSGIRRFITIGNMHTGMKSLNMGPGNQVICCENTFMMAIRELTKIRHTDSMKEKAEILAKNIQTLIIEEERQMEIFDKASKIQFRDEHIRKVMEIAFGKDKLDATNPSTRLKNQVEAFAKDLQTSVDEQGDTLWGLFNAVTRFTNHTRKTKDKTYSLMFGRDAEINRQASSLLTSWVKNPDLVLA